MDGLKLGSVNIPLPPPCILAIPPSFILRITLPNIDGFRKRGVCLGTAILAILGSPCPPPLPPKGVGIAD